MASPQIIGPSKMTLASAKADFAGLYEQHHEAVFRAALRVTGSPADAEDVLQTVFLRVLRGEHNAPPGGTRGDRL
jgi:DNA-directed RNA polymerase specialized sigma24 family protein